MVSLKMILPGRRNISPLFNVIDIYSRKNSVSVDQVKRMRMVMKQCPSRWSYKSGFAFTGK